MVAPELGQGAVRQAGEVFVAEKDPALAGPVKPAEDVEQGGLAGPGGAQKHDDLALEKRKINAAQGMHIHRTGVVDLGDTFGSENRGFHLVELISCCASTKYSRRCTSEY